MASLAPRPLQVEVDLGPVGQGASASRFFQAENGSEYIVKAPHLAGSNPFVGANELIAAELTLALGLPTVEWRLLELGGYVYFGCQRVTDFAPIFDAAIFSRLNNPDRAYDMVAFDLWMMNIDRHDNNIRARKVQNQPDQYLLVMIDHGHALLPPGRKVAHLPNLTSSVESAFVKSATIRTALSDANSLERAVESIKQLDDEAVRLAVNKVPSDWLSASDRGVVIQLLLQRKWGLTEMANRLKTHLPNLR